MDRFIDVEGRDIPQGICGLKSNMDRFIGKSLSRIKL